MKNLLFIFGIFVIFFQLSTSAHAHQKSQGTLRGWIGKKQENRVLDASGWHRCYSTKGGSCGRRSLTTGKSRCTSWAVVVGGDFTLKKYIPGLGINATGTRTWTACNTRSETITCSPKARYQGRAAVFATARYGTTRFRGTHSDQVTGKKNASDARKSCGRGYKATRVWKYCAKFGCHWRATCSPTNHGIKGMWPEKRWSSCQYRRF